MRILYWTAFYPPYIGGMETLGSALVDGLAARGHTLLVVTSRGHLALPDSETRDGVRIERFPFHEALETRDPDLVVRTLKRLTAVATGFAPELVHVNPSDASLFFHARTAAAYSAKTLVTMHVPVDGPTCAPDTILGTLLRAADWVTTVSTDGLTALRRVAPEVVSRSSVITNGGELPALPPAPLPVDTPRLLCIGRLVPEKGFDTAIDAFAMVAPAWPTARLTIAGDGPARAELEQQGRRLGLADRIDFTGWVSPADVPARINASTMMLVPSRWHEPFGLVALEAAQMARPVVASRIGGLTEVVRDGESGMLVGVDDTAALARAIDMLLQDPALAARMGAAGRERARVVYTARACVDAYEGVYRELIEETVAC